MLEGGAVIISAKDREKEKSAVEMACFLLKKRCTFEMKSAIDKMTGPK